MTSVYPSIRRLCHFILSNRNYSTFDVVCCTPSRTFKTKLKRVSQKIFHPLMRDNFTPNAVVRAQQRTLQLASVIALRKEADDRRPFDHFVAF